MYRVLWLQRALDELADVWLQADTTTRNQITAATRVLDRELQADPYRLSESREENTRVLFSYPLGVQIEADAEQNAVWVLHVWRFRRRNR